MINNLRVTGRRVRRGDVVLYHSVRFGIGDTRRRRHCTWRQPGGNAVMSTTCLTRKRWEKTKKKNLANRNRRRPDDWRKTAGTVLGICSRLLMNLWGRSTDDIDIIIFRNEQTAKTLRNSVEKKIYYLRLSNRNREQTCALANFRPTSRWRCDVFWCFYTLFLR